MREEIFAREVRTRTRVTEATPCFLFFIFIQNLFFFFIFSRKPSDESLQTVHVDLVEVQEHELGLEPMNQRN